MTKTERAYFAAAKAMSELSDHRHKLGVVVVNKHRIISTGFNSDTKCHKVQALLDKDRYGCECPGKIHAETSALLPLIRDNVDLHRATIYIYREHRNGSRALARSCPSCQKLIRQCGIKRMYYTVENGFAYEDMNKM
jgi:deoxycytidylate deaminase